MTEGEKKTAAEQPASRDVPAGRDVAVPSPRELDWFDRMFGEWPWPRPRFAPAFWRSLDEAQVLRVEEFVDGDEIVVRAEMPGIDPEKDVEITVSDHTLRMRAERREETKSEEKGTYRSEFRYGSFSRSVPLPVGASEKDVKATYKDGILEVRVPLDKQQAEAKKVKVERG
jgi:HSP20 family protein